VSGSNSHHFTWETFHSSPWNPPLPPNSPTVFNLKISPDMPYSLTAAFTAPMILSVPLWLFLLRTLTLYHLDWLRAGRPSGWNSSPGRGTVSLFHTFSRPIMGLNQPPTQRVPRVKEPDHEADHSPPTGAEIKNTWTYTSTPPYIFMAEYLIN
jgi:hypothetical protein